MKTTQSALDATPTITCTSVSPFIPVVNEDLLTCLSTPQGVSNYLNDVAQFGYIIQNLTEDQLIPDPNNNDTNVSFSLNEQAGELTLTGTLTGTDSNGYPIYQYKYSFLGQASNVLHTAISVFSVASASGGLILAAAAAAAKFIPGILGNVANGIKGLLGVADAGEAVAEAAGEEAAEAAGVALGAGIAAVGGVVLAVFGLAAVILELLKKDFQLTITFVNQSQTDYLIVPNYYSEDGDVIGASISCATPNPALLVGNLPPTICTTNAALYPLLQKAQSFVNSDDPNQPSYIQAPSYTLVFGEDGLSAPGSMTMLIEGDYTSPTDESKYGTFALTGTDNGWTGLVTNFHYHYTSDAPNIALMQCGADLTQAKAWYESQYGCAFNYTGSHQASRTKLSYALNLGDELTPQKNEAGAIVWNLVVTINDIS